MRRISLALLASVLVMASPFAQEADQIETVPFGNEIDAPSADSPNQQVIEGQTASQVMPANPADLLTGLYVTRATAEICAIEISEPVAAAMRADEQTFIGQLGLAPDAAETSYGDIVAALEAQPVDCAEGSDAVTGLEAVIGIYEEAGV